MNAAAFLDLDGTLMPPPSLERRFASYLREQGWLGARQWLGWLAPFCLRLPAGWCAATKANKSYLAGVPCTAVRSFADCLALDPAPAFAAAQQQLLWRARPNHRLLLITGTLRPLAEIFAKTLPVRLQVCATQLASKAGRFAGRIVPQEAGKVLSGPAKARVLSRLASEHRLNLSRSYAYGDCFCRPLAA